MIKICVADNHPVVIQGIKSYFSANAAIEIVATATKLDDLTTILQSKTVDVILLDIELDGISSIRDIKNLLKDFSESKIILFTSVSEKMYAPTAIKAGVSAYILKSNPLKDLENAIYKVNQGIVIFSDAVKRSIDLLNKGKKTDRLYKKLSTREVEVLRYLNDGKKNKEIAEILDLDEKTISTYKLRLLAKLNVTNLVDLLSKAKSLDII
ncbi:LuxR family transcriptional regulator [Flavobacterium sp. 316]|uniref:Response regulator transcription factor n=1 Tax=Flavobacterium sediminilitoris TaxID=2024526 RepID=A0ABY4HNB9_9FLAO|nr:MULTISPECIES: response regulator transcription factor [Flavobacterium]KIX21830.1 LuxR family transcriptional regulator [Flavobacterium sp. 316]UOX34350.1 response regulator transcription factor [Flavobacterium sediminilitoris]